MGFIIIGPFAIFATWSIFAIHQWLKGGGYGPQWWKYFYGLSCAGVLLGIAFAFFIEFNVANKRVHGFPIPNAIYNREKPSDPWVRGEMPASIRVGGIVTDFICGIALSLAPIAVGMFFKENRTEFRSDSAPRSNGPS